MTLDTVLNLVWAGIGVSALAALAFLESRRRLASAGWARFRRVLAVLTITISLFPCVSASDDLFSLAYLQVNLGNRGGVGSTLPEDSKEKSVLHLARLLQSLENFQIPGIFLLFLAICFSAFVLFSRRLGCLRDLPCPAARAPPVFSSLN